MIYNFFLLLFAIAMLPKILWQKLRRGKRFPSLAERLGFDPPTGKKFRIWIHAVSVGETKAAQPLVQLLRKQHPDATLLVTTSTVTGREEAKRSLSAADEIRFLPLDFSWILRRWARSFRPHLLLFIEGDLWPNLIREVRRVDGKIVLVSGKLSPTSAARLSRFPLLAKRLFGSLDLALAQNEEHAERIAPFTAVQVAGNLKLDQKPHPVDPTAFRQRFALTQPVLTIASTHAPEERNLLTALRPLLSKLTIFLAPRHPERFDEVARILTELNIPFSRWNEPHRGQPLILVDTMGQLSHCFAVSSAAIVCGTFIDRIGGHNLIEPCHYGCPVLFGPHFEAQREFAHLVLAAGAGRLVTLNEILPAVQEFLTQPTLREKALRLSEQGRGSAERTLALLQPLINLWS